MTANTLCCTSLLTPSVQTDDNFNPSFRNLDSSFHMICFHSFSVYFFCILGYIVFFCKNSFFTDIHWLRAFLMRLQRTADGSTDGTDESLRSSVRSWLGFLLFLTFLCSNTGNLLYLFFYACNICFDRFLIYFKDTLYTIWKLCVFVTGR